MCKHSWVFIEKWHDPENDYHFFLFYCQNCMDIAVRKLRLKEGDFI